MKKECYQHEMWGVSDMWMEGVDEPLRVVKVKEFFAKENKADTFYVLTQARKLSLIDLR
ncbi:MAG TPA: hypothetical protein PLF61_04060 [Candidatus Goldiibacteriota bacterium]|nr:hypothetical protein [Candidatus Goldiibacteriota bacterium]